MEEAGGQHVADVAEGGEFVHHAPVAAVVTHFALDVLEGVLMGVGELEAVLLEELLLEGVLRCLSREPLAHDALALGVVVVLPGFLRIVEKEHEQCIRKGEGERSANNLERVVEESREVHDLGHVVEIPAFPRLVIVR